MTKKLRIRKIISKRQKKPKTKGKTTLQTLILSKKQFRNKTQARLWVRDHNFRFTKIDEKKQTYRFRQLDPKLFNKKS